MAAISLCLALLSACRGDACGYEPVLTAKSAGSAAMFGLGHVENVDLRCDMERGTGFCPATIPTHGEPAAPLILVRAGKIDCFQVTTIDERGMVWRTHEVHRDPEPLLLGALQPALLDRVRELVGEAAQTPTVTRGSGPTFDHGSMSYKLLVGGREEVLYSSGLAQTTERDAAPARALVAFMDSIVKDSPWWPSPMIERPPPWR